MVIRAAISTYGICVRVRFIGVQPDACAVSTNEWDLCEAKISSSLFTGQ